MIIQVAQDYGLAVVAEGIEERFQLEQMRSEWARLVRRSEGGETPGLFGQGYFFARPLAVADFEKLLLAPTPWRRASEEDTVPDHLPDEFTAVQFGLL
jgi:sensor c-di-GMP phosphodiesterase-like protein